MKINNKYVLGGVIVLVLAVVAGLVFFLKKPAKIAPAENKSSQTAPTSTVASSTTVQAQQPSAAAPSKLTYTQAVEKYKNARMQFDANCQTAPSYMTFKNPATVMLDNRSGVQRKIAVGGRTYSISAFGFVIAGVSAKTLPAELYVSCDAHYNVAKILLQK